MRRLLKTDLFDEATGAGLYPELATHAEEVYGVDVSPATVRAAVGHYPQLQACVGDVLALPFADGEFDAVFSNSTLDHFDSHEKLRAAVGELARTTRVGGTLLITLDNRLNPIVALRTSPLFELLHRARLVPYFLGVTHGPRGLAHALRSSGFQIQDMAAVMHCPPRVAAKLVARRADAIPDALEARHVARAMQFERMARWPTRYLTGHFVAALAVRS